MNFNPAGRVESSVIASRPMSVEDIFIPVLGMTGAGKTTFISTCTQEKPLQSGRGLSSCTSQVTLHTMTYNGRTVHLIDTPGFNGTHRSDGETLQELAFWLIGAFQRELRISGIVYLHQITAPRLEGSSLRGLNAFKALCGEESYPGIALATTRWDEVDEDEGALRQQELCSKAHFWGDLKKGGCHITKLSVGRPSALKLIQHIVKQDHRLILRLQRQMIHENKLIHETDLGQVVYCKALADQEALDRLMAEAKCDFEKAASEFHDRRIIASRNAMAGISTELSKKKSELSNLQIDMESLQTIWDKKICEELEELRRKSEENAVRHRKKTEELERLRQSPLYSQSVEHRYEDEFREIEKERNEIEVVRRQKIGARNHTSISTVVGTGLALGQFIAMLACTVM
ncbi:uncharacterized protein BDZ99DRAFT_447871 [Mytilinidion resinicola]|uniref:G domain-containing protein n=1 Tax=Mytilinidion resinicola TaxID=574789 RepID=A0A6A6YHT9_9PEZI|nr:uncharacterized protein BDZ99DRAFT_447871 [Mytilinidion resinicola]KAF2807467.1 hypothetical protein BDZ99DRAFT_447871 [Mytilinidion resinicola]